MPKAPRFRFFSEGKGMSTRITKWNYGYYGIMANYRKNLNDPIKKGIFTDKWRPLKIRRK